MKVIGGMFPLEKPGTGDNGYLASLGGDAELYMSGRCALYACLEDIGGGSAGKTAYVPSYTCETVLAPYEKAGYRLRFYDIDPENMRPVFREGDLEGVSVMGLCGYYGFIRYDGSFPGVCHRHGVKVVQDTTHSPYFADPEADYLAGSLRKWMGVAAGGVAVKRNGRFSAVPLPPDEEHLKGRYDSFEERSEALRTGDESHDEKASGIFWETELRLRRIFDSYAGDELSERIIRTFDFDGMRERRRRNYMTVLSNLRAPRDFRVVFDTLEDCDVPSHFTVYADDRDSFQQALREKGISSTVYWPRTPASESTEGFDELYPGAAYIYDHVCSIQIDQRYGDDEMRYLASVLNAL